MTTTYDEALELANKHAEAAEAAMTEGDQARAQWPALLSQVQAHALLSITWSLVASNTEPPGGRGSARRRGH